MYIAVYMLYEKNSFKKGEGGGWRRVPHCLLITSSLTPRTSSSPPQLLLIRPQGQFNSIVSGPIWPKFEIFRDFMHVLVTSKYKKDRIKKQPRKGGDIIFPIISQWGLPVAMETRFLIQSAPKPYAAFLQPNDATYKI